MSQKPRTGSPATTSPATRPAVKTAAVTAPVAKAEPAVKLEPVAKTTAVPKPEPVTKIQAVAVEAPRPAAVPKLVAVVPKAKTEPVTVAPPKQPVAVMPPKAVPAATSLPIAAKPLARVNMEVVTPPIVKAEASKAAAALASTNPTLTQGMKSMMKTTEDLVAFSQANLEAFVKSGQIWSAGVQELTKQIATSAKASFEESVSTFKAISTAKSVKEAMDLQSTFAKAALEKAMAESNKLTDASIKLTEQTLAPITARVTVAVETFGKAA